MTNKKEYNSTGHRFLRPESFCAEMARNGFSFENMKVKYNSAFRKSYRNEIEEVNFNSNDFSDYEMEIVINRDGLYDRLPEGIFHQTKGNSKTSSVQEMTNEHRRFKEEEKQARKFFQPLEQEFFRYSTLIQQEELNLCFGMLEGDMKSELFYFWNLPNGLPEESVKKLLQIMPWANYIKGNMHVTAKALELLLATQIQAEEIRYFKQNALQCKTELGKGQLGISTVVGNDFQEPSVCWNFSINNLKKKEVELYRPDNSYGKFLKHFEEIFIPLEIDIIFDFSAFSMDDETEDVLGYSFVLG